MGEAAVLVQRPYRNTPNADLHSWSATRKRNEFAQRGCQMRRERLELERPGGVEARLGGSGLVRERQQHLDRLRNIGQAESSLVTVIVRRINVLRHPLQ